MAEQHEVPKSEVQFINRVVAIILATGMYTTVGFYLIGLILLFVKGRPIPHLADQYFHSFGEFFSYLFALHPRAFLYLGTISLILTPVSRVLVSIFAFWKERDFKYVGVTTIVFLVIVISVIIGSVFKISVG